jgi:hypothetical protein
VPFKDSRASYFGEPMSKRKPQARRRNEDDEFHAQLDALRLSEDDYDEIKSDIDGYINTQANLDAAAGHSYLGDQDMLDLEDLGYEDQSAVKVATFGNWDTAINSDVLVSPGWYEILDLKPSKHPQLWSEAETKDGYNAGYGMVRWLEDNGFERIDRLSGAWPGGSEMEIPGDAIVEGVVLDGKWSDPQVEFVYNREYEGARYVYWTSDSGDIDTYAKPLEEREDNPFSWADEYQKSAGALGAALGSLVGVALAVLTAPQIAGILSVAGGGLGGYYGVSEDRQVRGAWGGSIGGMFGPVGAAIGGAIAGRKPGKKRSHNPKELKRKLLR